MNTNYENIQDIKNINAELDKEQINEYVTKYAIIISEFILYNSSKKHYRTLEYNQYVTYQGIQSLFHIYHQLLMYTKNIELVCYHVQKAYYYYVEFISQINKEQHSFLQFNIKDAIMFIYKKTIFNLDKQLINVYKTYKDDEIILRELYEVTNKINHLFLYVTDIIRIHSIHNNVSEKTITNSMDTDKLTEELFCKSLNYEKLENLDNSDLNLTNIKKIDDYDRLTYVMQKLIKEMCKKYQSNLLLDKINDVLIHYKTQIYKKTYVREKHDYTKINIHDTLVIFTELLEDYIEID